MNVLDEGLDAFTYLPLANLLTALFAPRELIPRKSFPKDGHQRPFRKERPRALADLSHVFLWRRSDRQEFCLQGTRDKANEFLPLCPCFIHEFLNAAGSDVQVLSAGIEASDGFD